MRGQSDRQSAMFYVIDIESRIVADHPLRSIKRRVDEALRALSSRFAKAYSDTGRPSVPPERLLKALLLQALYSIRSERQLVERINTDLLFRWFLDMNPEEPGFDSTAFTHNRPRLEKHGLIAAFFDGVVRQAIAAGLTSDDHFSVDGTLIESYASIKSFRPIDSESDDQDGRGFKPRNAEVDFHGQKRSNATHRSTTDPQARLYKKGDGQAAKLYHMAHAVTENRHGLVLGIAISQAAGDAEPTAAIALIDRIRQRLRGRPRTLGADKGYDRSAFLLDLEQRQITPHVPTKVGPIGGKFLRYRKDRDRIQARQRMRRRERTLGYRISQRVRKKLEEAFGWLKTVARMARTRLIGQWKIAQQLQVAAAAYNLVRMRRLLPN